MKFCINVFQLKILHELLPSFSAIVLAVRWFGKVFKLMQTQQNYSVTGESSYNEILSESICNRCRFFMQNICQIYNMFGIENLILDWLRHKLSFELSISIFLLNFQQNISCTHCCILSNVLYGRFRWVRSILNYSLCVVVTKDSQQKAELDKVKVVLVSSAKSVPSCCFFPQPRV